MMEDLGLDVRITHELFNKIKVCEYATVFFATYGMGLSMLLYEMKDAEKIGDTRNSVLAYNGLCTFSLLASIYTRYEINLKWQISRGLLTEYDTLSNTGWWKSMICEMLVNIIAPYPYLDDICYTEYNG